MRTEEGKLHLFVAIDRTSKYAFAQLHAQADRPTARAFLEALIAACPYRLHTILIDNGIQFAEPFVGGVGDSYDNALAETINGLYKAEGIHRRGPWRSFEAVELATLEWVGGFDTRRLLAPIGDIPPAEAEAASRACLET